MAEVFENTKEQANGQVANAAIAKMWADCHKEGMNICWTPQDAKQRFGNLWSKDALIMIGREVDNRYDAIMASSSMPGLEDESLLAYLGNAKQIVDALSGDKK
jgi:hypothetical protein